MVILGSSLCIRAKVVALVQSCCIRAKVAVFGQSVVFGQKWLYFGKIISIRAKWSNSAYVVVFGQSGSFLAKSGLYSVKTLY